jgi:hypothetical protein
MDKLCKDPFFRYLFVITLILIPSLALNACQPSQPPDLTQEAAQDSSDAPQESNENEATSEDLTVRIENLPERFCINQPYDLTVTQSGFTGAAGDVTWALKFGPVWPPEKTDLQESHTFKDLKVPTGPVRTEPVRARVEIIELSGDDEIPLVDLTPVIGTFEKEVGFIYCIYNLNLGYSGDFKMEIFDIKEAANLTVPIAIEPVSGNIEGSGTLNITRTQEFSQEGVTCSASWEGSVHVDVSGTLDNSSGDGGLHLIWTFANTDIPSSNLTCSAGGINVPAAGGPADFSGWGLDNLVLSPEGGEKTNPVSKAVGPANSGSGTVTIKLEPVTGN